MKIMCQLCDYLFFLLISYLRSIVIYKLLVDTLSLMCLACCVAERVGLYLDTIGMVHLYLDKSLCKHLSKNS